MRTTLMLCAAAGLLIPGAIARADDPRVEAATGRDLAVYPPDRHFDHLHMRLEFEIPDMGKPAAIATETLTVTPIGAARGELVLDAGDHIKVESVTVDGKAKTFTHEEETLTVKFDPPVAMGQKIDVVFKYKVDYPKADGTGLTWTAGNAKGKGLTDQAAQIHSQGEAESNHQWFICQDFPNERLTTELLITVEDPYVVGANGRLISSRLADSRDGKTFTTWHWLQDKPHANYLVCMVVGRFAIVGLPPKDAEHTPRDAKGNPLPVYLYAPLGTEQTVQKGYANTPSMIAFFAEKFDEPFPWDKYSQALVRHFNWGGMENTSITTMQASSAIRQDDDIISHELCHQWTGDLMTCKGWEHLWLNEGWASFGEALWNEEAAPAAKKKQAYQRTIAGFVGQQRGMNRTYAPAFAPLVSNRYGDPQQTFMKANDVYAKGACVLHILRQTLGDDAFFKGVRLYMDRCKFTCVETDDFRHPPEDASGLNLERVFSQWCDRPGLPRLEVSLDWVESTSGGGDMKVTVKQNQRVDADNPAYTFALPLVFKFGEEGSKTIKVPVDTKETMASLHFDSKPEDIVVDPDMTVIAPSTVHKPLSMWLRQIDDKSVFAQVQAAEALATWDDASASSALVRVASDSERVDLVRRAAAAPMVERFRRVLEGILNESPPPGEPERATFVRAGNGGGR